MKTKISIKNLDCPVCAGELQELLEKSGTTTFLTRLNGKVVNNVTPESTELSIENISAVL